MSKQKNLNCIPLRMQHNQGLKAPLTFVIVSLIAALALSAIHFRTAYAEEQKQSTDFLSFSKAEFATLTKGSTTSAAKVGMTCDCPILGATTNDCRKCKTKAKCTPKGCAKAYWQGEPPKQQLYVVSASCNWGKMANCACTDQTQGLVPIGAINGASHYDCEQRSSVQCGNFKCILHYQSGSTTQTSVNCGTA
ncbi:hypothetical protein OAO01_01435 [Oligoflexia bacterium]|nr:hypothetical protein [Oligoflexia bacterium]